MWLHVKLYQYDLWNYAIHLEVKTANINSNRYEYYSVELDPFNDSQIELLICNTV